MAHFTRTFFEEHLGMPFQVGSGSMTLKSIAGIDLDGQAVKRGLKRIQSKHAETLASIQAFLHFTAYEADTCCQPASLPGMIGTLLSCHFVSYIVSCTPEDQSSPESQSMPSEKMACEVMKLHVPQKDQ